jgi:hypothetical protein
LIYSRILQAIDKKLIDENDQFKWLVTARVSYALGGHELVFEQRRSDEFI